MSYLDLARKALEKLPQPVVEVAPSTEKPRQAPLKPWNPTPADEATICRAIEKDQGLPPGSVRLYTPEDFRQRFGFDHGRPIDERPEAQQYGQEIREQPGRASAMASVSGREWDDEARELIEFFESVRPRLPRTPFRLTAWLFISNPDLWYRSLELDISLGPLGCRARMGALQDDLRRLRELQRSNGRKCRTPLQAAMDLTPEGN